jgi:hypothetical protein
MNSLIRTKLLALICFFFSIPAESAVPIIGEFETSNPEKITGWACINGISRNLHVHAWSDDGDFIGGTIANGFRGQPWSHFCGDSEYTHWSIPIPKNLWDGKTKNIRAFAIDIEGGGDKMEISGSPKIISMPSGQSQVYRKILDQSEHIGNWANIDEKIRTLDQPQNSDFFLTINYLNPWGSQAADKASISGNKIGYTSHYFQVNTPSEYQRYQRGPIDTQGATFAQLQGVKAGMYIDTSKQPTYEPAVNIAAAGWFGNPVNSFSGNMRLNVTFEAAIPVSTYDYLTDPSDVAVSYLGLVLNFGNKNNPNAQWFYYSAFMHDPRGTEDIYASPDGYTGKPIVGHPFSSIAQRYGSMGPRSMVFTRSSFSDFKYYHWTISRHQFQNVLNDLIKRYPGMNYSANPDDYVLTGWNLGPESVRSRNGGRHTNIGVGVRNIQIFTTP